MKEKKWVIICLLLIFTIMYSILSLFTNLFCYNDTINYIMMIISIGIGLIVLKSILNINNDKFNSKDKLFNSLVQKSDTLYLMVNAKNKDIVYISENVEEVLGISKDDSNEDIIYKIMNISVIKEEIAKWDKVNPYVSSMVKYDNPKYNYDMWIKIKIFPYTDKNGEYYIIQIIDATKEHDRQHLLISQATNIKAHESVLSEITSKSYDFEINVNLLKNSYELKYFKKDKMYFGEEKQEKRGLYTDKLKNMLQYINESDRDLVASNLNIEALKEHFDKYELDSITFRYRVGSEVKNNTWLESTIFFITDRQRNTVTILTKNVTEDAESIREQNVMLQNALNEAKLASKSKTELISAISHDIRTPLTNIVGLSDSLLKEKLDSSVKEDIKNINDSSNEMISIIDGLLDTTSIEKKLVKKDESNYSVLKMFKILERNAKEYIGDKQIKLNINLDSNLPVILFGDYKRITRAITEIINNSIKYTNEGSIDVNVRGEKISNKVKLIIEVKDTGIGIEEDKLDSIMNDTNNKGITLVKNLVKILDGEFVIESKKDEYTKATISFVQKIVEDNKVRKMIDINKNAEEFSLKGRRILVVDDNSLNLKVTKRLLEPYDVDVTLVESGQECIDIVKELNNFDLIFMDQMMPGMSGVDTMNKLKEIEGFDTPIVVLTADAMQGQKEKYLKDGFYDYISKPIDKGELSRVLKRLIKE